MWFDFFVQSLGFIAIGMNIIAVQFNKHWPIMFFKSLGSFLFAMQYLLLGAFSGMVMDLIGVIRNFIFAYNVQKDKSNKWWIVIFSTITVIAGIITIFLSWSATLTTLSRWTTNAKLITALAIFISFISVLAKLLSTIGYGVKSPHAIRMINLPTFSMWIVYNFIVNSIAGMINDSMSIVSIIIAEIRFRKKPQDSLDNSNEQKGEQVSENNL